mmetsp:Transcript_74058/g.203916  ORF Transcript_74058/g.203916 Transcript_74058/m.203916 type:complete len:217 (-) Transcript_74058:1709-2359(-)
MRVRAKHALNNCTSHVAPRASSSPHSSLPPPPHLRPSCAPTSHLSTLPSVQCTAATPRIACAAPRYAAHASLQARCHQTRNPALHATTRTRPRQSCGGVPQLRGLTLRMQAARAQTHRVTATRRPRDAHVTRAHLRMQPSSPAPRHSVGVSVSCKCCTCAVPSILQTTTSMGLLTLPLTTGTIESETLLKRSYCTGPKASTESPVSRPALLAGELT